SVSDPHVQLEGPVAALGGRDRNAIGSFDHLFDEEIEHGDGSRCLRRGTGFGITHESADSAAATGSPSSGASASASGAGASAPVSNSSHVPEMRRSFSTVSDGLAPLRSHFRTLASST